MKTQITIVGAGPAGLMLGRLLALAGIDFVILERKSRPYVEARIRAGVLESGTVEIAERAGVADRLNREGLIHDGFDLAFAGRRERIDLKANAGQSVVVYGQTELTKDLIEAHLRDNPERLKFECPVTRIEDLDKNQARIRYCDEGQDKEILCDFIAGCDGSHGVCRSSLPETSYTVFERVLPAGWLGVLSDTPPVSEELIYARHDLGFALCSMRSHARSRYYVEVPISESVDNWSDEAFWDELKRRLPDDVASSLVTGPSIEKSIAPLRSVVTEPMRFGRLFLAGDAAHIVPPTGAKGLNLAISDITTLFEGLKAHYYGDDAGLDRYSETCLARIWKAVRFSWWFTHLTHRYHTEKFDEKLQLAELDYIAKSSAGATVMAENYVGLNL